MGYWENAAGGESGDILDGVCFEEYERVRDVAGLLMEERGGHREGGCMPGVGMTRLGNVALCAMC